MKSVWALARRLDWVLIAILLLGLSLRLWGIDFGLPYMYHPDEGVPVGIALRMLQTGNLNPEFFNWPSLLIYLNALVYLGFFVFGCVLGWFANPADLPLPDVEAMAVGKAGLPEEFLIGRGLTVVFGVLCILLVYLIVRQISSNRLTATLAALLVAVDPVSVKNSHFIRPDTFAVFFVLVTVLFALKIVDAPNLKNYLLAASGVGLATSSKYNVALVVVSLGVAHLIKFRTRWLFRKEIYIAAVVALAVFLLTTPFAILDFTQFLKIGPSEDAIIYSTGHPGAEGNSLQWYIAFMWSTQGWTLLSALGATFLLLLQRESKGLVLLSFPLIYFVFINLFTVHFDTTILPIFPFVAILAALFIQRVYELIARRLEVSYVWLSPALGAVVLMLVLPSLRASAAFDTRLAQPDGRDQARLWIDVNLPIGSRVALEPYSPYLDRKKFVVQGFAGLQDHLPDWYVANGYAYLVFSQGIFGRYFADPTRYSTEVDRYKALFSQFTPVALFDDNDFEIRIYKTGVALPAHRVAARFGNEGELIELVGYDGVPSKWMPGQPLQVKLTWRTIEQKSEPFEVELRLLDKNGREVSRARGDLFQGKGWQEGMFSTDWTIPAQASVLPGAYQLEVNVIESRYGYRTPAQNWGGDKLDRVDLGPIKMSVLPPTATELMSAHKADVRFGDAIFLQAYFASGVVHAGGTLPLTLCWQSLAKPSRDYTVFIHLADPNGNVVAQVDAPPRGGAYPTSLWDQGEIIPDEYVLQVPAKLAPGSYRIEIGLYEYPSLARLPAVDANGSSLGDHWFLPDAIQVVQ